ncbi:ATP phosphoribosyltransferase regulatory subunit [Oricola cellulosilytica]|uniref:ATP phosphoribosyltransferase regulatory subunit n=1 Tax=Oricola cellulosilytica TaxID=1429082 RepID=A0A4R0PFK5_9HYPH|nr:ATP phosphoribosyltransferase regulatory subunit [Oricola cellulosilytica]TCD16625.1 ATP phosphoribosyltransferase regulatory subunit [Oricola cellulosilytica]
MNPLRSFSARADIETILAELGADRVDVPVLQPADPFLDTAGEELRRRIFLSESETGETLCLRPEFTIPVCLMHIGGGYGPRRYGYVGTVFRQRRAGSNEFLQAGIEDIGDGDRDDADARSVADALSVLQALGVKKHAAVTLGDQAVFNAVIGGLGLPKAWALRLAHAFGDHGKIKTALDALSVPAPVPELPADILEPAEARDRGALLNALRMRLRIAGLEESGGRDAEEIADRLMARFEAATVAPDESALAVLRAFLALRAPVAKAVGALSDFGAAHGLALGEVISAFAAREGAMQDAGVDMDAVTYDAAFGRPLDYYTALVYEITAPDGAILAGGGRYDRLLTMLGAEEPVPGVGFSVWLDRVAAARGQG